MLELIFFDCDGVLVDSEPLNARVSVELLARYGIELTAQDVVRQFTGKSMLDAIHIVASTYGVSLPDSYIEEYETLLFDLFRSELKVIDGVRGVLSGLQVSSCVTSNSTHRRLAVTLATTGLNRFFGRNVFSAEDVARGKPEPDIFLHAASAFGANPKRCVVIDDNPSGIMGAVSAGAMAIGFCGGSHIEPGHDQRLYDAGAHEVLTSMSELLPVLTQSLVS